MFLPLVLIGFILAAVISYAVRGKHKTTEPGARVWVSLILAIAVGFLGVVLGLNFPNASTTATHTYRLEALTTGTSSSGSFFLGSGTIGNKHEYQFVINKDGAYYSEHIDSDGVPTYENKKSSKAWVVEKTTNYYTTWIFPGVKALTESTTSYVFHIPKGSVVQNFNITGEKN